MAEKGKIKVINNGSGGIITSGYGSSEYSFDQPNHQQLCLNEGDKVKFDVVTLEPGTAPVAVNVQRITAGTIVNLDGQGGGLIEERQSSKKVPLYQPFSTESGLKVGDIVRYNLIPTDSGELAVNLSELE